MARLTIGEVAAQSGLASSAIRYYEREGLIPKAPKEGGRRVYEAGILDRLAVIELAKQAGMTIRETRRLLGGLGGPGGRRPAAMAWQRMTRDKLEEIDARIEKLEEMKHVLTTLRRCECPTLDDCGRALRERNA